MSPAEPAVEDVLKVCFLAAAVIGFHVYVAKRGL